MCSLNLTSPDLPSLVAEGNIFLVVAPYFPNEFPAKHEKAQTWPLLGKFVAKCDSFIQPFSAN